MAGGSDCWSRDSWRLVALSGFMVSLLRCVSEQLTPFPPQQRSDLTNLLVFFSKSTVRAKDEGHSQGELTPLRLELCSQLCLNV